MSITEGTQPAAVQWTGAWTTAQTTASFTPESGALLVALLAGDSNASGTAGTGSITDSLSGTWTLLKRSNAHDGTVGGTCEIWCRDSPNTAMTVSATGDANTASGGQLVVRTLIGALAAASQNGATGGAQFNTGAVQISVAADTGSKVYGAALNWTNSTAMTALGNTTVISADSDATNGDTWEAFKSTGDTAGTATYGYSSVLQGQIAAAEIKAAAGATAAASGAFPQPGSKRHRNRFYRRQILPSIPGPAAVSATAEVAVVGVPSPFQTGGETDLQLISDAALAVAVTALPAVPAVSAVAGVATAGAAALAPSTAHTVNAAVAVVGVVANAATANTSGSTSAPAGAAAVSVAALAPSVADTANAGVPAVQVAAVQPSTAATATAGAASAAAVSLPPVTAHTATAAVASAAAVALAPQAAVTVNAGVAVVGTVGNGATVNTSGSTNAPAGVAAAAAAVPAPTTAVVVNAAVATVGTSALAAQAGSGKTVTPGVATVSSLALASSLAATARAQAAAVLAAGLNVPPKFTVGTLTAATAPGGSSGGALTATTTRTGGPS